jgi:N-acylneuraminate cytidylyltransferase
MSERGWQRREVVAVIPARAGSRGISGKNLCSLGGHPLIAWAIEAGLRARRVDRVLVSTDDEEIRATAHRYGAGVPFLRPPELARDDTPDLPVFQHVLAWLDREGVRPRLLVQLRPTSPLRPPGMVDEGVGLLLSRTAADSVRSVTPSSQNPYKMWRDENGRLKPLQGSLAEELFNLPRQRLPATLWQTGHLDVVRPDVVVAGSMTGSWIAGLKVPVAYAVDVDGMEDIELAEWRIRRGGLALERPELRVGARRLA